MPSKKQQRNRRKKATALRKIKEWEKEEKEWKKVLKNLKYLPEELRLTIFHMVGLNSVFQTARVRRDTEFINGKWEEMVDYGTATALIIRSFNEDITFNALPVGRTIMDIKVGNLRGIAPAGYSLRKLQEYCEKKDWWKWSLKMGERIHNDKDYFEFYKTSEERWDEIQEEVRKDLYENVKYLNAFCVANLMVFKHILTDIIDVDLYISFDLENLPVGE